MSEGIFTFADLIHAFVLLFFIKGITYICFPGIIKGLVSEVIIETTTATLRLFGFALCVLGYLTLWLFLF